MMDLDQFQSYNIMANSTTKAEYMTAIVAAKEGFYVKQFVTKLGAIPSGIYHEDLLYDNSVNIVLAKGLRSHQKTEIIQCHLIEE